MQDNSKIETNTSSSTEAHDDFKKATESKFLELENLTKQILEQLTKKNNDEDNTTKSKSKNKAFVEEAEKKALEEAEFVQKAKDSLLWEAEIKVFDEKYGKYVPKLNTINSVEGYHEQAKFNLKFHDMFKKSGDSYLSLTHLGQERLANFLNLTEQEVAQLPVDEVKPLFVATINEFSALKKKEEELKLKNGVKDIHILNFSPIERVMEANRQKALQEINAKKMR